MLASAIKENKDDAVAAELTVDIIQVSFILNCTVSINFKHRVDYM